MNAKYSMALSLDPTDHSHYLSIIETCASIQTETELVEILDGEIRRLLDFENFACGIGSALTERVFHVINGGFPDRYISHYVPENRRITSPVFLLWKQKRHLQYMDTERLSPARDPVLDEWACTAKASGIRRMASHGLYEPSGNCSYFAFANTLHWDARKQWIVELLMPNLHAALNRVYAAHDSAKPGILSKRERQVLQKIACGISNSEIANQLHLSPWTIKIHTTHILQKLSAASRGHAVALGIRLGLIET